MSDDEYVRTVERTIAASPAAVFALLSDPRRHQDIDGSDTLRGVQVSDDPLRVGSTFDMHMHHGFPYRTRNTVLELEPDRLIAWTTRPLTPPLCWLIGGRIWRYELFPDGTGTRIVETWDLRPERRRDLVRKRAGDPTADMQKTLERIDLTLSGGPQP